MQRVHHAAHAESHRGDGVKRGEGRLAFHDVDRSGLEVHDGLDAASAQADCGTTAKYRGRNGVSFPLRCPLRWRIFLDELPHPFALVGADVHV